MDQKWRVLPSSHSYHQFMCSLMLRNEKEGQREVTSLLKQLYGRKKVTLITLSSSWPQAMDQWPKQYTSEYIHNTTDVNMSTVQNRKTNWIVWTLYANYIRMNVGIISFFFNKGKVWCTCNCFPLFCLKLYFIKVLKTEERDNDSFFVASASTGEGFSRNSFHLFLNVKHETIKHETYSETIRVKSTDISKLK